MTEEEQPRDDHSEEPSEQRPTPASNGDKFFIVGIGASAGGLEALTELVKAVKLDCMGFVVVQHLAPTHESVLPTLLGRTSSIDVVAAADGMKVEPNKIYVIPPNTDLAIMRGALHLIPPPQSGPRLPIDYFFRSLAQDQGARAIGIILSGTGTDGTFGLRAIKEAGGITFVQEPSSAKYDGMPRNALESGVADFCLTPQAIAEELLAIGEHPYLARTPRVTGQGQENISKLLVLIRTAFHNDLTYYKPSTIERRVERRMALHKIETLQDYVKYVQSSPDELRILYKDVLISVTSFFRDPDAFTALQHRVLSKLPDQRDPRGSIRIWVPACSTGEEAYSIAIALLETLGDRAQETRIQIFGTDVDDDSIVRARRGIYPQNIALDVSPERLHRFFIKKDDDYQVCRRIRDIVVFSTQNVTKDAPFSRLDLVSCRNLLIYLQPVMQKKVLRVLHYALKPNGHLMLGTSETVGDSPELFSLVDRKNKIYAAKHVSTRMVDVGFAVPPHELGPTLAPGGSSRPVVNLASLADRKILEIYGPPGVVINENMEILHFRGRTGPYLEPAPGMASLSLLRLARPELHAELRRAVHQALAGNERVSADCRIIEGGAIRPFKLEVLPIVEPESKVRCLLVLFHEPEPAPPPPLPANEVVHASPAEERIQELERELLVTKEYLQSTIEELESSNEELKSSNEELQSSNEELQSTNEELETSKEELQSSNEELTTVNDELQTRMAEQQQTNDDLHNVLAGVDNAVVIAGMDLRIRRFTSAAERVFNLVPGDIGRSIQMLNPLLGKLRLEQIASDVIQTLTPFQQELQSSDQHWYTLRITPYKTLEHSITGVVITLADIDVRKRALQLGQDVAEYAGTFLDVIGHPLMIIDRRLRILWANHAYYQAFRVVPEETVGALLNHIGRRQWNEAKLLGPIEGTIATGGAFRDVRIRANFPEVGEKSIKLSGSRIPAMGGEAVLILLSFEEFNASS